MTQYIENTLKLINKENNFEKSNSKLAIEIYEDLIDFSAVYFTCYDNAKKSSISNDTKFKVELESKYGSVNINLEDGTYSAIEKEKE